MKLAFRCAYFTFSRSVNPNPSPHFALILVKIDNLRPLSAARCCSSSPMVGGEADAPSSPSSTLQKQFDGFRNHLEESGRLRESIRAVTMEIESANRFMHSGLLRVHQSRPVPEVLKEVKSQIGSLKELYHKLAEILQECPGQYYRYHGDWRSETQTVVSLLAFMHWLETGNLLLHPEAEEKLGLNSSEFGLDIEDYLIGICFMSNELPRYVVNQVTAGDYDCPRKVLKFLTDLHAAFRMLNLRNDFLRKKFDGMKYDLRRVEEVYYDVKIRGLAANGDSMGDQEAQGRS
ncbi:uncharacterized protein LOC127789197 [Diospyros lotus]|uniref:uncharacterized protein LOC127789197 n=1 Tax=Diospyros lotus TaxID=55363 RepID=UPI002250DBFC|nr:uncharacterized protein LOC127789197 [Diospyros lotus]